MKDLSIKRFTPSKEKERGEQKDSVAFSEEEKIEKLMTMIAAIAK